LQSAAQGEVFEGQVFEGQVFEGQVFESQVFEGQVLLPSHECHSELKLRSNGAEDDLPEDHPPTVIARCETRQDVQLAIRTARAHGLAISVGGGESDSIGRVLKRGGMVIDLSAMRHVAVDPATRVAIVAGGAMVNDVVAAAAAHGLTPVTGNYGAASLAGVTLAGGYGPLLGRYGLAADNLLEAEIVLKNGQYVIANSGRNADLFWALRGGARDFGVTTSLRVRLHALPSLLSGMIFYAWSDADLVFRGYSEIATSASECLTISAGIVSRTDGNPLLFAAPTWCGEPEEGERVLSALQAFGTPVAANVGPVSYADLLAMHDDHLAGGSISSKRSRRLPKLDSRAISAMIVAANARMSPLSAILLHHFHGAPTRVHSKATAFGPRQEHFLLEAWHPSANDNAAAHRLWVQNVSDCAAPKALVGDRGNQLWPGHRLAARTHTDDGARLSEVKQTYNPEYALSALPPRQWGDAVPRHAPPGSQRQTENLRVKRRDDRKRGRQRSFLRVPEAPDSTIRSVKP
jgi:FAD binding domain